MKKVLLLLISIAVISGFGMTQSASAIPSRINNLNPDWTTFGNNVSAIGNVVNIQRENDGRCLGQEIGAFGAEFSVLGLSGFSFETDLSSWDSSWYDYFSVTATQDGQTETLWSWGGNSWTDGIEEFDQGFYSLVLPDYFLSNPGENTVVSFQLTTQWDRYYTSEGSFTLTDISIEPTPTATSPVPEPATFLLFGAGLVGITSLRRRKSA